MKLKKISYLLVATIVSSVLVACSASKYTQKKTEKPEIEISKTSGLLPASKKALGKVLEESKVKDASVILDQMEKLDRPFPNSTPKYYDQLSRKMYPIINQLGKCSIGGHDAHMMIINDVEHIIKHNQACCAG